MAARAPTTQGVATAGPMVTDDHISLPVLILLFGQEYAEGAVAPSQHWYGDITSAAGAVDKGDESIFTKGADLFDALVGPRLEEASKLAIAAVQGFSPQYKARVIGSVFVSQLGKGGSLSLIHI